MTIGLSKLMEGASTHSLISHYSDVRIIDLAQMRDLPPEALKGRCPTGLLEHGCLDIHGDSLSAPALTRRS